MNGSSAEQQDRVQRLAEEEDRDQRSPGVRTTDRDEHDTM